MDWFELLKLGLAFLLSGVLCFYLTPTVRRAAIRFGIVDRPDEKLKTHGREVAYLGGIPVFMAFLFSLALAYEFDQTVLGILLGTTIIIILGLIDDFGVLTPAVKMGGQLVAVWLLFKAGISIQIIWLPDWVNWALTVFWILGITNAFNLIDVMDGLATGVALIASVFLSIISFLNGNFLIAAFTLSLAGSLLGFLPHNWRPAKIFLGDTGSLSIGFILAALTINEQYTVINSRIGILAPLVIMGIPIFETVFLIVIRSLNRVPIFQGSPDHFAIRLKRLGWSVQRIVLTTYGVGVLLGILGLIVVYTPGEIATNIIAIAVVAGAAIASFLLNKTRIKNVRVEKRDG